MPCGHLLGKGWPLGSRLWCLTVSLSLSHWYPGSGVVLDCIDPELCTFTYFACNDTGLMIVYSIPFSDWNLKSFQ